MTSQSPGNTRPHVYDWIAGGGEMGKLIRGTDWSRTPLGSIEFWPQSLRSAVSILLPSKAQIVMFWGPDLITLYNDAYRPVLGKKHPHALGLPGREVWSEVWETGLRDLFEGVLQTGEAYWARDRPFYLERYGFPEETFFDISYDPIRDETDSVAGLFCIVSETTARVVSERRLRTLGDLSLSAAAETRSVEDACRTATEILSGNQHDIPFALVYLLDESGKRVRLMGTSGLEPGTMAAPLNVELTDSKDSDWPLYSVMQSNRAVEITDLTQRFGELSGGVWPEAVHTARVMPIPASGQDRATGFLVAGVSPRRPLDDQYRAFFDLLTTQISTTVANARAYEAERRRAEALAELDRAKTTFFSNVSHEFRTPLTLMLGPVADMLAETDSLPASQRDRLEIAHRNGLRLQKLVNTLLDFSRIEAGRIQASYEPTDLSSLTAELASNFRSACDRAGIDLVVACPPLSEPIYVDPDMWEKIVLNLISNAFKFTLSGRIEVRLRESGEYVELSVHDTGVGIPAEELSKVFERFQRVEVSRGRTQEGSGIGLALVRELVKLHGGSVRVESVVDEGSVFTVTLPKGNAHLPQDRINAGRTLSSTASGAEAFVSEALRWLPVAQTPVEHETENRKANRRLIVLADDNADMRDYVSRLLSDRYEVVAVGDGQAALDVVEKKLPDLVLSDVMMPVMDGIEFLGRIRADEQTREIPVILLSARAGEESRIEALKASADDYLVKPFSSRELLATVDAHIKTVEIRRQRKLAELAIAKQNKRLLVLWEAAGVLLTTEDPNTMLRGLFEKIRESLSLDVYFNFMVPETKDVLELVSCAGVDEEMARSISPLAFGQAVCGTVAMRRAPIVATFIQQSSEPMVQLVKGLGLRAYACNPLMAGGRLLGTLSFASRSRDSFEQEEIEFLEIISHYVTLAYERLHLIDKLREQDRRKDEFLATLAHELRNPLAPILNGLQLIRLSNQDQVRLDHATTIMQRQIEQMVRLVDDLLDVGRISRNKLELRKEMVDLESVVRSAVDTSRPVIEASQNDLQIALPAQKVLLDADPVRLAQVVSNLLNNAARYSRPGGRISLTVTAADGELIIKVSDTGIGIAPEKLSQIFDMFVQLDSSDPHPQGGLGVGLTLVRRLIEMHGGTVEAHSDGAGKGSEFIVRLATLATETVQAPEVETESTSSAPRRILVVDDNVDSAESMAMMLELSGHAVVMAHDGAEAVELAKQFQPDVAFLDLGMPKLNGYEAARSIREQPWGRQMLLVALTGWGQEDDKRRTREAGFDAHIVKPIDFAVLEKLLATDERG
ncbi:MAG TPA: ATP-binding protein [Pyrinomonadaceae bacterium]